MRLKHIKLVGFKSFVDSTTVPFPEQMTAIVGPNGCGKSNVIDAVRWVLGESSAKNLRGDAMTDVIFNGSTNRKPVSQASVELVFDNTEGKLKGQLADRSEISVKRSVTKDATSTYYLNGTKCRRRDITDIFLGTGLGPRSYAIIEQGMISRLIESKPQELRVFLEEAAGISKYKERRRETETRIKHTRENLERLADVREELGTQLEKLKRQSATAKRYKELKKQERQYKAELAALKWHKYNEQLNFHEKQKLEKETALESFMAQQRGGELGLLEKKQELQSLSDQVQTYQEKVYQAGNHITKLEQQIIFQQQAKSQQSEQLAQVSASLSENQQHIEIEQASLEDISQQLIEFEPEQELLHGRLAEAEQHLFDAEQRLEQHQLDEHSRFKSHAKAQQNLQIIDTKLHHQQTELAKNQQRLIDLKNEQAALSVNDVTEQVTQQQDEIQKTKQVIQSQSEEFTDIALQVDKAKENQTQQQDQLAVLLRQQEHVSIKLEQLEQWKEELEVQATNEHSESSLTSKQLLITQLEVSELWRQAVEQLLEHHGNAYVVNTLPKELLTEPGQYVRLEPDLSLEQPLSTDATSTIYNNGEKRSKSIAAQITSGTFPNWFNKVATAETIEQAEELIKDDFWLAAILPTGQWVGRNWTGLGREGQSQSTGVLKRLEEIRELKASMPDLIKKVSEQQQFLESAKRRTDDIHNDYQTLKANLENNKSHLQKLDVELEYLKKQQQNTSQQQAKLNNAITQTRDLIEEQQLVVETLAEEKLNAQEVELELQIATHSNDELKSGLNKSVQESKMQLESLKQESHQLSLKLNSLQNTKNNIQQNIQRATTQLKQLEARQKELLSGQSDAEDELLLKEQLEQALLEKLENEELLMEHHKKVADIAEQIKELEQGQSGVLAALDKMRDEISNIKMDCEGARVRAQNMLESLQDMEQALKPLLENMPEEAEEKSWAENLEKATSSIQRLGAINLAAIEEYELQAERKGYLDEQYTDLTNALETLESAIRKIDRESRSKFKDTFDQVNEGLQTLFPKVFGGGAAYLELTGDDLLDTGVTIMARPPGKKNSTIHLLSGGEKALTALSLVFSIFKLNPAPFCMLDEVDAPLDDANVGRFCKLVNEMSDTVQFIYISHNKVAMEMATHLTGVTMQEPGVSRLVAVDIQQAVEMAEAV